MCAGIVVIIILLLNTAYFCGNKIQQLDKADCNCPVLVTE